MIDLKQYEVWFITGSQHLYGDETLKQVNVHSEEIARALDHSDAIPIQVVFKPVLTTPSEILNLLVEANANAKVVGVIAWMHTFSPAKMWINGLKAFSKPLLHLHTQYNQDIPWSEIDMDFMNLNQSAHGGREFGFMASRMRLERKVVVGHWKDQAVHAKIGTWLRSAAAWSDLQGARFCRFGDNMRYVAVTDGNKVSAEMQFGFEVNGYGIGDLVKVVNEVSDKDIETLIQEYEDSYDMMKSLLKGGDQRNSLIEAARIEIGLRTFLTEGSFKGFTDTFEDLHGLVQLPGIAVQRLMKQGYGFGAEGDWKTAALCRAGKVMSKGLPGGSSFMEDYTYHLNPSKMGVLGSHMLEIDEDIAASKPKCEIHPLGIGGKADPVRLVFDGQSGPAINATLIDMGNRFRLLVNKVETKELEHELPKLPVARVFWECKPDMQTAVAAWIYAGGAHHTLYSTALNEEYLEDFAAMAGVEYLVINEKTDLREFKNELRWNDLYYKLN